MRDVFVASDNILSPIGNTTAENFKQLKDGVSGVKLQNRMAISADGFYASLFEEGKIFLPGTSYTRFEQLLIASIENALAKKDIICSDKRTALIISSTKGNISLLEEEACNEALSKRIALTTSAKLVAEYFQFTNKPVVVSNACISGVLGILTALRLIRAGEYDSVIVAGADVITKFVLSGFQSFQAIANGICKPFDKDRDGINLGEGGACVILSSNKKYDKGIRVVSGATSNDANHISGPSRTGEELGLAIRKTIGDAGLSVADIDFISAHGTATMYNDEMEAKAISLTGLETVPVNSLKAYYGHTLGAAGLIESVVTMQSMREGVILPTAGFKEMGVTKPINVCNKLVNTELRNCIKTASGFGGCNGAVIFSK